jgi:hypothetical protein
VPRRRLPRDLASPVAVRRLQRSSRLQSAACTHGVFPSGPMPGESSGPPMSGGEHAGDLEATGVDRWHRPHPGSGSRRGDRGRSVERNSGSDRARDVQQRAYDDIGRSARGSREFPTPDPAQYPTLGTPKLTCLDDYATRHTDWCQDWVMKLIRKSISPYDEDAPTLRP